MTTAGQNLVLVGIVTLSALLAYLLDRADVINIGHFLQRLGILQRRRLIDEQTNDCVDSRVSHMQPRVYSEH